ncbi:hypothetical protein L1887_28661 [Cichorium endivia]|nr:hypothetical protein L1887_28661 [Cichorium endivia]
MDARRRCAVLLPPEEVSPTVVGIIPFIPVYTTRDFKIIRLQVATSITCSDFQYPSSSTSQANNNSPTPTYFDLILD